MKKSPIIILCGEPNSVFSEIFIKAIRKYKSINPIILIGSKRLFELQLKKLKIKYNFNLINIENNKLSNLSIRKVNFLDVKYKFKKPFEKISSKSNKYINHCFKMLFEIIKKNKILGIINAPISKKFFLKNKFQGVTEFLAKKFRVKNNFAMLIFNNSLAVTPITTHLPINKILKNINKKSIILKTTLVNQFYKSYFSKRPRIAFCGLNPHCENFFNKSEEDKIIKPAINYLKKKRIDVSGPFPSDTVFLKQNRKKYDVIIGMYHDQVLGPLKAIYGFNAINITLGLPVLRISPDHGPNYQMMGKNKSNSQSLIEAIKFLDKKKC